MATQATITPPANAFLKFHQFSKLEDNKDDKDAAPTVWGVATWEKPDSDNEVCDYETAVPVYQAWSSKAMKRTKGAGQDLSLGNIRLQHGSDVGGKATKLEFNDDAKEVWLGSEPINDEVKAALKGGYYTGYSQGGSYAWRACDKCDTPMPMQQGYNFCPKCNKDVIVRYGLKRIAEVSYVDSPATGEGFEHVKANGSIEILKFQKKEAAVAKETKTKRVAGEDLTSSAFAYVGDPEKTETWKLPIKFSDEGKTKRHIRNALARFEQTKGIPEDEKPKVKAKIEAAAKEHGIEVGGEKADHMPRIHAAIEAQAVSKTMDVEVVKSLYTVSRFADILESFSQIISMTLFERDFEGDDSEVPEALQEILEQMAESFIAMATEEVRELTAKKSETKTGEKTMTPEELKKAMEELDKAAKKSLAGHFAKAASHHEKKAEHHEALAEHHDGLADMHKKFGEAHKADANEGSEGEARGSGDFMEAGAQFHKAAASEHEKMAGRHEKLAKMHKAFGEHCDKMSSSCDDEESKKVAKELKEADAAVAKADEGKTANTGNQTADEKFARTVKEKAEANLLKDPDFLKAVQDGVRATLLAKLTADGAAALAAEAVVPTAVKGAPAAATLVTRGSGATGGYTFAKDEGESATGPGF